MAELRRWLGWIIFITVIPTAALLQLLKSTRDHQALYYFMGVPALLLYFCIVAWLGPVMPFQHSPRNTAVTPVRKVIGWLSDTIWLIVFPAFGLFLVQRTRGYVDDRYFLGPFIILVSGLSWISMVQFFLHKSPDTGHESCHD